MPYKLISHTKMSSVFGLNGSYRLKASQICKVHTCSHEITNEKYMSNFENTDKTMTTDLTHYDAETNTSDVEKIVNRTSKVRQTTSNWSEEDTQ